MRIASRLKTHTRPSTYLSASMVTLSLVLFAACFAEFGRAAVIETHGNTVTIKPFDWINNTGKKKSALPDAAGTTSATFPRRRVPTRFGVGNEGPYNYAMTHDGYLLAQFTASNPNKEADLHLDAFWPGGIGGLEAPFTGSPSYFEKYALLLFLESKEGDRRVACSAGAVDVLNCVNESQISQRSLEYLTRRYDPIPPAANAEDYTPTRTMTASQYNLVQAAVASASNLDKVRFYFVGSEGVATPFADVQKGEFALMCHGPDGYGLFLKHGEELLTQFWDDHDHLTVFKMEAADANNLIKSGDRYAFIYEVEGRICKGEEKKLFCAAKRLRSQGNLVVGVETTRLYLLRLPLQTGGLKAANISLLNTNILPARIQMPRPDASAIANYPSNGGRSPEKQRQIDAAVEAAQRARAGQESAYGAAAARGVGEGADAASRIFDPNYNVNPNPY